MSFRALVASTSRATHLQLLSSIFSRGVPLASVRRNSSIANEWLGRKPNFLLSRPRIVSMLADSTTSSLPYTEKSAKLREGWADNSDLQSTDIYLTNIPSIVTVERVKEYVSKFGTVIECYPSKSRVEPSLEKMEGATPPYTTFKASY
jgi:hypothetical protein